MASGLCVPHKQAAHMAAPTEGQNIKKALANGEPSTHGAKRTFGRPGSKDRFGEKRTFALNATPDLGGQPCCGQSRYSRRPGPKPDSKRDRTTEN